MATFNKIPTLLGMTFLLAMTVSCERDDYYDEAPTVPGDPDHRGYVKPTRPRVYETEITLRADGRRLIFTSGYRKVSMEVVCRNIGSGETIHSTVTAESPVLELTSQGVWEVEVTYAGEHYLEIVEVSEQPQSFRREE